MHAIKMFGEEEEMLFFLLIVYLLEERRRIFMRRAMLSAYALSISMQTEMRLAALNYFANLYKERGVFIDK